MRSRHAVRVSLSLGLWRDGLGAALQENGQPPAVGSLDNALVTRISAAFRALVDGFQADFQGIGDEAQLVQSERSLANALLALLTQEGMQAVGARLNHLAGRAEAEGLPFRVLIDARRKRLEQLPWELLEAATLSGTGHAGMQVLRLWRTSGLPPAAEGPDLLMEVHALEATQGSDPTVAGPDAETLQRHSHPQALRRHNSLRALSEALQETLPSPGTRLLLERQLPLSCRHIHHRLLTRMEATSFDWHEPVASDAMAEGEADGAGDDGLPAETVGPRSPASGIRLEVLEVVAESPGEGRALAPGHEALHQKLLMRPRLPADVPVDAMLLSALPWHEDAAERFFRAFYQGLQRGLALVEALQDARRRLTAPGVLAPGGRWWQPRLFLADASLASPPPALALRRLPGLTASGDPEAEAVLGQALNLARHQGFLGIEHLALGLAGTPEPPPLLAVLQPRLANLGQELMAFGIQSTPNPEGTLEASRRVPPLTPRFQRLLAQLPPGFDLEMLTERLLDAPQASELLLLRASQARRIPAHRETLRDESSPPVSLSGAGSPGYSPMPLEVVGGPEDGRLLILERAGQQVGRWDPDLHHPDALWLYEKGLPMDRTVSRRHLRYGGRWNVEVLAPLRWEHSPRASTPHPVRVLGTAHAPSTLAAPEQRQQDMVTDGWISLEPGDILRLGAVTRLRVLTTPEEEA